MEILFTLLVIIFATPAWVPIIRNRQLWPKLRQSLIALSLSGALQLVFVNGVALELFLLNYSLRFAAIGVPCSVLALVLCARSGVSSSARVGVVVSSWLSLAMWLLFITLH
jgi:hypothetical protein